MFLFQKLILCYSLIGGRFGLGVYVHDEFGDTHLFIKHRPIWKPACL